MTVRHPRIACCVPHCRRGTTACAPGWEWICGPHWQRVPRPLKNRRRLAKRLVLRAERRFHRLCHMQGGCHSPEQWQRVDAARRLANALWDRCKEAAVSSAVGI